MGCVIWDADLGCVSETEWLAYDEPLRDRALDLAWSTIAHLTGGLVGACPVVARPCRKGCGDGAGSWIGGTYQPPFTPMLKGGFWYNVPCGCKGPSCHCGGVDLCEVVFPGYVALIENVWVDGKFLDADAYRLDNGNRLVRQDGECWPSCQNLAAPWYGLDAFSVIYYPGIKPSAAGLWAAGILAVEFAKACSGEKCRLPSAVTSIARQGVSMEFSQGMFPDGHTGIREVDAYVLSVNPNHLVKPPLVWSPDLPSQNMRTTELHFPTEPPIKGPFGPEFAPDTFTVKHP